MTQPSSSPQPNIHEPDAPQPDTIATPEGDNEFRPGEPLYPAAVAARLQGLQIPQGNAPPTPGAEPHPKPSLLEEVIDEISHGTLLP
jgi:hypothetical protein